MKLGRIASLLVVALFVTIVGLATGQAKAAQTQGQQNLLTNPGFEAGYYNQDNIPQMAVPNGWRMHWLDNVAFPGSEGRPAYRPETVVWNISDAPPDEKTLFFRDGSYALKVFKGWAPLYAALSQDLSGLQVGRRYRFVVPIFIDIIEAYEGGQKVAPERLDSGMIRLGASPVGAAWRDEGQITYSGWWTAETVQPFYLAYPVFVWDFTATQESMTLWVEMVSKYPYRNNGFFLDGLGLFTLDQVDMSVSASSGSGSSAASGSGSSAPAAPAGPTPTPVPLPTPQPDGSVVHIVEAGDTFWTIAIRYAPLLNMTPEDALPAIRELNNDPAFINVGQELEIAEPGTLSVPEPEAVEAEATEAVDEAAGGEETEAAESEEPAAESEEAVATEPAATEEAVAANAICVAVYNDENGDGSQDASAEALQADAAISLFKEGRTLSTYVSDGISEPYCFEDLESGTYQVQIFPPADYKTTTPDNWAVAVANGVMVPVNFGTQYDPEIAVPAEEQVAQAATMSENASDADITAGTVETATSLNNEPGGLFANVGAVVLGIAVVLVLLAGVGVVLLRRS
ncbi:MAG TPA: SdrD B-like domain-containing protein [Anaerolineae bacterium]